MKDNAMNTHSSTLIGRFGSAAAAATAMIALQGCVFVDVDSPPWIDDYSLDVYCDYDAAFGDYFWDFYANISDPDGDITDTYVDIIDYYTGAYLETFDLAYDGGDQYSNRIYETYSGYLVCPYVEDYEYDFWAVDSYGNTDSVTLTYN